MGTIADEFAQPWVRGTHPVHLLAAVAAVQADGHHVRASVDHPPQTAAVCPALQNRYRIVEHVAQCRCF